MKHHLQNNRSRSRKQKPFSTSSENDTGNILLYGRMPPQAREIEEALLGMIMLEADAFDVVSGILTPECFYVDAHQEIYRAIHNLQQKGQPIDLLTTVEELKRLEKLESAGGVYYITRLTNNVVSSASKEVYARIVLQKFIQRELVRISSEIMQNAYEDSTDVFDLLDQAEEALLAVGQKHIQGDVISIDTVLVHTIRRIEEWRRQDSAITGVPSGFPMLDRATRGWQPGLIILAARPSVGKTALALNLVRNAVNNTTRPVAVAVWSLEMDAVELVLRLLSAESEMLLHRIQTGNLDDDQMKMLYHEGIMKLAGKKIFFDDAPGLTLFSMRSKARRLKKKYNIGLIIVDYLQLMNGTGDEGTREQEIARISRGLKLLSKELNIPIIALSQLSRAVETRTGKKRLPQLSDLRESGAIEQDADVVIFLWAPDEEEIAQNADLLTRRYARIAKQRSGMLLTVDLEFQNEIQLFKEYDPAKGIIPGTGNNNWTPLYASNGDVIE